MTQVICLRLEKDELVICLPNITSTESNYGTKNLRVLALEALKRFNLGFKCC